MIEKDMMFLLIIICLLLGCEKKSDPNALIVVTSADYPPYASLVDGKVEGIDVDIARAVAQKMGKTLVLNNISFTSIFSSLRANKADMGVAAITESDDPPTGICFSKPYFKDGISCVLRSSHQIKDTQKMKHLKVAVQMGVALPRYAEKYWPKENIVLFDDMQVAFEALKQGKVDVALCDSAPAVYFAQFNPDMDVVECKGAMTPVFAAMKEGSPLKAKVDAALQAMEADGTLARIQKKWMTVQKCG